MGDDSFDCYADSLGDQDSKTSIRHNAIDVDAWVQRARKKKKEKECVRTRRGTTSQPLSKRKALGSNPSASSRLAKVLRIAVKDGSFDGYDDSFFWGGGSPSVDADSFTRQRYYKG